MKLAEILGVLGFGLSIVVFALTRWERRKTLTMDIECVCGEVYGEKFKGEVGEYDEIMIVIRVMNVGARAVVIAKESIEITGPKKNVRVYDTDWYGINSIPYPLNPGESFEVGLFLESFTYFQGYKNKEFSKDQLPVSVTLSDIEGKSYKTKSKYELLLEVNDIRRFC